jgi:deazaflavin-dependent oxidoreductase (nitroreductase family)
MTSMSRVTNPVGDSPKPRFGGILGRAVGITNPMMVGLAGKRWNPFFGVVEHVGRKSGRSYSTPIAVRRVDRGFIASPAFGLQVDWYRNLVAAGGGSIRWRDHVYPVRSPVALDRSTALAAFTAVQRFFLRLGSINNYVFLADADVTR